MKVAIVVFSNLRYAPYIRNYAEVLDEHNIQYDIIYWNRKGEKENYNETKTFSYNIEMDDELPKIRKMLYMYRYARYVKNIIKKEKYDFIICCTTLLGVFLSRFLIKNYTSKFILDIRDYSYEHISFYKKILSNLLNKSALNIISSPSFREFLPKNDFVVCHNMTFESPGKYTLVKVKDKLRIAFVGVIRYADECERILNAIMNNNKIDFYFYGDGEDENRLKKYCEMYSISNVTFQGKFLPKDKEKIYESIDVIYNCYGNQSNNVKYALSNKFYESFYYKKPILVNKDTSMAKFSEKIGFAVRSYETLVDDLFSWYMNLDEKEINEFSNKKMEQFIKENQEFSKKLCK